MEVQAADVGTMGRRMPRIPARLTPREPLGLLLGGELSLAIVRRGHAESLPDPRNCDKVESSMFGVPPLGGSGIRFESREGRCSRLYAA